MKDVFRKRNNNNVYIRPKRACRWNNDDDMGLNVFHTKK